MGSILERTFDLWREAQIVGCNLQNTQILARYAAPCLSREFQYAWYWNPTRNKRLSILLCCDNVRGWKKNIRWFRRRDIELWQCKRIVEKDVYPSKESIALETIRKTSGETEDRVCETIQRKRNISIPSKYAKMSRKRLFLQEEEKKPRCTIRNVAYRTIWMASIPKLFLRVGKVSKSRDTKWVEMWFVVLCIGFDWKDFCLQFPWVASWWISTSLQTLRIVSYISCFESSCAGFLFE